ncbi:apocytochrome F [Rubidibacter lacunae KORDI 51-2]|uniref:Cytochrome f n=1 Tax=Rubidibacter lacunae KORDI 51-2 TaxID=582515 RepID=U5DG71_9CHRO|nr:apocytochrome f [Rubidibacter lacunae]ERN40267.1 apocytochrome F [Rubidibacter lacunae KORDI 51-2]
MMRKSAIQLALVALAAIVLAFAQPQPAAAYPFWAQETAPDTPREATGRIVCANCHLAEKPAEVELPLSVLPDSVFEAVVKIPYDASSQQVLGDGSKGGLNVGAVLMLPEGFKIAPPDRISPELQERVGDVYFQPYAEGQENVVLVGPLPGDEHKEIVFPVLAPDPATDKNVNFGKFAVHLGANRGRGQVYPTGQKSNNTVYTAAKAGKIDSITDTGFGYEVAISSEDGSTVTESIPPGPKLLIAEGDAVAAGTALTTNPNVGGFGQEDAEIVLQSPTRILGLLAFIGGLMLAQLFLVLKKKQVERVQAAEMDF